MSRLAVILFRRLARLYPEPFRERWLRDAESDLRAALLEARRRGGARAAAAASASAVWDLLRGIPREWWVVVWADRRLRTNRFGMGEHAMIWITELRLAARALLRRPGFTAVAVVTLALGIGANVAIFSVVDGVLLRPLPYRDADDLVAISHHAPGLDLPELGTSPGMLNFYWAEADFVSALAGYDDEQRNLMGSEGPDRVEVILATPQLFQVLDVRPELGRAFTPDDAAEGASPVAVLTHATWVQRFASDPDVVGRTIEIDGTPTEVVGIMPEGFAFPDPDAVALLPLYVGPDGAFGRFGLTSIARLAPGLTVPEAQRRVDALQSRLTDFFPDLERGAFLEQSGWSVTVERFQDHVVGDEVASTLWVVLGTVGFVLLIACANVANLLLVRAESRQKELAVRSALGAGRGRVAGGFLAEAVLLGLSGGAVGVAFAWGGVDLLVRHVPPGLPRVQEIGIHAPTLLFAAVLSLFVSLLFGSLPLLKHRGAMVSAILRDGGRASTSGRERHRARNVLVAVQLALALVLLVGSGLMLRSFDRLRSVDPGFDASDLLTVGMSLGEQVDHERAAAFYQSVADRVAALPGVTSVGLSTFVPLQGGGANGGSFYIESKPRDESRLPPVAMYKAIGADYLDAMGQVLVEGRALEPEDWRGGEPVALVNETFARRYLDGHALGEGIKWDEDVAFARVVGVVRDVREFNLREEPDAWAYLPMIVGDWGYPGLQRASLVIRSAGAETVPVAAIREIVGRLDPSVPLTTVQTMREVVGDETAATSFTMVLLGIAAAMALLIGAVGLFGVVSYVVAQRTREIGVRVALGASRADIRGMVFRQSAVVAGVGIAIGLVGAAATTRVMGALLYGISATDPVAFVAAPLVLVAVVGVATWLPSRRASRVDPIDALRNE